MSALIIATQLIIALGIYNVWLLRMDKETAWRGGTARNMEEEFHVYGLSKLFMNVIRVVKLAMATLLIVGIWYPPATTMGATMMAALMLAAVLMHMKVRDPVRKSLPAASLLILSLVVALSNQG
jgi:DoxX-like family